MAARRIFYMCEHCFQVHAESRICCGHRMAQCDAGEPGSDRSRPLYTAEGELRSHAPRWWLERHRPAQR